MKIWHRAHLGLEHKDFITANAIKHEPWFSVKDPTKILDYIVEIEEEHPAFQDFKILMAGKPTYIATKFSLDEIAQAEWVIAWASHSIGSFVPEGKWWSDLYYADRCNYCGSGWRQTAPFRIKKEPKLGNKHFADFGSGFELFCRPEVLSAFKRSGLVGFDSIPVIIDKDNRQSESVRQLVVTEIAKPAIAEDLVEHERYSKTICVSCGCAWHAHYTRGVLPLFKSALNTDADFILTDEWFGNGRTARREILFSKRVVNLVLENRWSGIQFTPIKTVRSFSGIDRH